LGGVDDDFGTVGRAFLVEIADDLGPIDVAARGHERHELFHRVEVDQPAHERPGFVGLLGSLAIVFGHAVGDDLVDRGDVDAGDAEQDRPRGLVDVDAARDRRGRIDGKVIEQLGDVVAHRRGIFAERRVTLRWLLLIVPATATTSIAAAVISSAAFVAPASVTSTTTRARLDDACARTDEVEQVVEPLATRQREVGLQTAGFDSAASRRGALFRLFFGSALAIGDDEIRHRRAEDLRSLRVELLQVLHVDVELGCAVGP
jgi:hypothetical protein